MSTTPATTQQQYIRDVKLVVYKNNGQPDNGLDLSQLRIKFVIKRSDTQTPNTADIRVYNLEASTAANIKANYGKLNQGGIGNGTVILEAGYVSNRGVIFKGNIKQIIIGIESGTETFIDIIAGDGDNAYNFSIVNTTIAAGATQSDQISAAANSMSQKGVTAGNSSNAGAGSTAKLPRGKVIYGNAKAILRQAAKTTGQTWSIQDEALTFVPLKSYLPGQAVVLTSATGMIGAPQQTTEGVNVKCLINPLIKIGTRIQIDNASVELIKINFAQPGSATNIPAPQTADGVYYVMTAEHSGDTRGVEWYTKLICLTIAISTNPINSVGTAYG